MKSKPEWNQGPQGSFVAVRMEPLAKRVLKLSVPENRPAGWEFSLGRLAKFMGCSPPLKAGLLACVAVVPLRRCGNWAPENWYSLPYRRERKRGLWRELKLKILIYIELLCWQQCWGWGLEYSPCGFRVGRLLDQHEALAVYLLLPPLL